MAGKFELWVDKGGDYRWNLKAGNGEVIATSQGYASKASALNGIDSVRRNAADAEVVEIDEAANGGPDLVQLESLLEADKTGFASLQNFMSSRKKAAA